MAEEAGRLIRDVAERVARRGAEEQAWFMQWRQDFREAVDHGDEEDVALMLDMLVAFDRWQRSQSNIPRRRPAA